MGFRSNYPPQATKTATLHSSHGHAIAQRPSIVSLPTAGFGAEDLDQRQVFPKL